MVALPHGRPAIMGILNVTDDSFSDGGLYGNAREAIDAGLRMIDEGADLIDVGGESTRPGADPVPVEVEIQRVLPVVEGLTRAGITVSIDTMKPEVASRALDSGVKVVNDVNGLRAPGMLEVVTARQCSVCVMHMLGEPKTMQQAPHYEDVVREVRAFLMLQAARLEEAGMPAANIWIDPGIGFGKTVDHNLELLRNLGKFVATGYPVLLGVSRKSFIGRLLGGDVPLAVGEREEGTLALHCWAHLQGVRVLRTHSVLASARALKMLSAVADQA